MKAIALAAVLCAACGNEADDRCAVTGRVTLGHALDGGDAVSVVAYVTRDLQDGGSEQVLDAGVALNGVPLGTATVDASLPGQLSWSAPSFPGALPLGHQTLAVIDSAAT